MGSAAFFDVDGTVTRTGIVLYYLAYRRSTLKGLRRLLWSAGFAVKCAGFGIVDLFSRPGFNRWFYRSFRGIPVEPYEEWCQDAFREITRPRIFPGAAEEIRAHREAGRKVILVTGSPEQIMRPLADHLGAEGVIANRLEVEGGRFTGRLSGGAVAGGRKVDLMRDFSPDVDLADSFGYSDSITDLPMLQAVGHPVAVNPGPLLGPHARRAGWPIKVWKGRPTPAVDPSGPEAGARPR
jgi:HAD superfamily hydrolase (TIGR01490 family)